MGMATSLVALALLGSDPIPTPTIPALPVESREMITCQMQMTTVGGLAWRTAAYSRLTSIGQKGSSTIWIADRAFKADITGGNDAQFQTVEAPKITTFNDATGTVMNRGPFQYIGDVERVADGPINQATKLAFSPKGASVEIGFTSQFTVRRLDQGVLAQIKVAETHISAMHRVGVSEFIYPPQEEASTALTPAGKQVFQHFIKADAATVSAPLMLPEVASSEVEGEWLVPNDAILIISMGIDTVTAADGKSVVQERLAIYDFARPTDASRSAAKAAALGKPVPETVTSEVAPRPRMVADLDLPPLPEAYASADLNSIDPGSPLASTQPMVASRRSADSELALTALQPVADAEIEIEAVEAVANIAQNLAYLPGVSPIATVVSSVLRSASATTEIEQPAAIASNGLSMPRVPDRSYPAAKTPTGDDYELPPLPEAYAATDLNQIEPGTPVASPQTVGIVSRSQSGARTANRSSRDDQMIPAGFESTTTESAQIAALVEQFLRSGMPRKSAAISTALSMPRVPDRSCPEAVDSNGQVVESAPVAEAYASAALDQTNPGVPLASPQSASMASTPFGRDPQLVQTNFAPEPNTVPPLALTTIAVVNGQAITRADLADSTCQHNSETLANLIEKHLRKGMGTEDESIGGKVACPAAANCPYSATGCDTRNQPASSQAARIEMGLSVRDGKGTCVYNSEDDLNAALKTPGKTEIKYVPLGGNMSLQIEAKVVPTPKTEQAANQRTAYRPKPVADLIDDAEKLRKGVENLDSERFWFLDQPSHVTPFPTHGGLGPDSKVEASSADKSEVIPIPLDPRTDVPRISDEIAQKRRLLEVYQKHETRFLDTRNQVTPGSPTKK